MLEKGYIDGFMGYEESWDYVLKQKGLVQKFRKTPILDSTLEYVVSLKGIRENSKLLDVYDEGKRKLIKNGRLKEIKSKWFGLNKIQPNE
jgi:polar amino acid transport system substrate-binding protein